MTARGRRYRRVAVAAASAVAMFSTGAVVALTAGGSDADASTSREAAVGAAWHGLWSGTSAKEDRRVLDELAGHGLTWVRLDVGWASVQPSGPGRLDAREVDRVRDAVAMAQERGLRVLGMFWLTPGWAGGESHAAPRDPGDYAAALARLAVAVPRVEAWEVWNEPNRAEFFASEDPAQYARLLRAAHDALEEAAPDVTVVMGGTAYNDATWIERALASGAAGHYDVMATHPYSAPSDMAPDVRGNGTRYTFRHLDAVRWAMQRHGDGDLPVWLTEVGWSTHRDRSGARPWERGVTEARQAQYSARVLRVVARDFPWVDVVFFYNAVDHDTGTTEQYDNYGLMRDDLSPKPVLGALAATVDR